MREVSVRSLCTGVLCLLALLAAGSGVALGADSCVTATMDEAFRLPDGTTRPAGDITLCLAMDYSPVSTVHFSYVDRRPVGMFSGHREIAPVESAYTMTFVRGARDRTLRLTGYTVPGRDGSVRFHLEPRESIRIEDSIPDGGPVIAETVAVAARLTS